MSSRRQQLLAEFAARERIAADVRERVTAATGALFDDVRRAIAAAQLTAADADTLARTVTETTLDRLVAALGVQLRDPRGLAGSIIIGAGDAALVDATQAILQDTLTLAVVADPAGAGAVVAAAVGGRINLTGERAQITVGLSIDGIAAWLTELYAIADRAGFLPAVDAAVDQRTAALDSTPDQPAVTDPGPDDQEGAP